MKICVLGLGYMGLPTACLFATNGHEVIGVDINPKVVEKINNKECPFKENGLTKIFEKAYDNGFRASLNVEDSDVFIIAVPTPVVNKHAELKYVFSATEMIMPYLKKGNLVILESTVVPGTTSKLLQNSLERSRLNAGEDFYLVHCPERAIPGNTLHELIYNDRIIGGVNDASNEKAKELYSCFVKGEIFTTDATTAELVKVMENTSRDINIAMANEFALIAEDLNVNVWESIELANKHPRVNILQPGPGVGGHCIAVDPWFIIETTKRARMIKLAREINSSMPYEVFRQVKNIVNEIDNPNITVFGLAYKANVDDTRESPSLKFIEIAKSFGLNIETYDPFVKEDDLSVIENSDCIVILTGHDIFRQLDWNSIGNKMRNKNVFDARNMKLELENFNYRTLGK